MKKLQTKIWILTGILLLSISANAMAQDTSFVTIEATIEDGCTWSGTPYLATSSLTVADNDICVIQGAGRAALNVTVDDDTDSLGQAGGRLIIGGISTSTTFTVGGLFNANGIVEVGAAGNPAYDSQLITNDALAISDAGNDGDFDIIANTNGSNSVDINNTEMLVGSPTTTGTFTNNDDAASTFYAFYVYGTFENLHASGIITAEGGNPVRFHSGSTLDNDGTINVTLDVTMYGTVSADNSGTVNITNGTWFVGTSDAGTVNLNTSGDINVLTTGAGKMILTQYGSTVTNTGAVTSSTFLIQHGGTFTNNSGGTIDSRDPGPQIGMFAVWGGVAEGDGTFNNNSGATVITDDTWIIAPDLGTGPNYTDKPTINNADGASFTTDSVDFSFADLGAGAGITAYGGIINNDGTFVVTDGGAGVVNLYRGAKLNNTTNGTFTMSGTTAELLMSKSTGGAYTSECGATDDTKCQITNTNVTDLDAFDVSGQISLWQYSELNNNGNMVTRGANNIDILENNTTVINGANGDFELAGTTEQVFNFDVTVDNDGAMYTNSTSLEMADTGSLDNAIGATLTVGGAGNDLTLYNSSSITTAGDIIVPDDTLINDDAYINQSAGTFTTIDLLLVDLTPTTPYLTMTGGTVTASANIQITEASIVNVNGGTLTGDTLLIGNVATSLDGGTLNVDLTGAVNSLTGGYNHIYKGTLDIKSTSTNAAPFTFDDRIHIEGDALEKGILNHYGSGTVSGVNVPYIYKYGELNIDNGTWDQNNANIYLFADPTATIFGELNIGSNGTLYDLNQLQAGAYNYSGYGGSGNQPGGTITNYGTIQYEGFDYIILRRGGKLDNYGTIDLGTTGGNLTMEQNEGYARTSYFINQTGATLKTNDFWSYHPDHIIENYGEITVKDDLYLGSATYEGGLFENGNSSGTTPGSIQVGDNLYVYKGGELNNNTDSTISGITTGTLPYDNNYQALKYDNISINWPNFSQTVTGGTSGATATVVAWDHNINDGVLFITGIAGGPFLDGETLQGSSWGTSTADGVVVANEEFTTGDTITGSSSGATATIKSTDPLDTGTGITSGTLTINNINGTFTNDEAIIGASQGSALTSGTLGGDFDAMDILIINGLDGALNRATVNQYEGTDAPSQAYKITSNQIGIQLDGELNNYDYISTLNFDMGTAGGYYNGLLDPGGGSSTQDSFLQVNSTGTMGGTMIIEGTSTDYAKIEINSLFSIYPAGDMTLNGDMDILGTSARFSVGGIFKSGTDSNMYSDNSNSVDFDLRGGESQVLSPNGWVPWAELGGTIDVFELNATDNGSSLNGGYLCIGDYTSSCVDSGNTVTIHDKFYAKNETGTGTTVVDIAVDLDLDADLEVASGTSTYSTEVNQLASSTINITNSSGLNVIHPNSTFNSGGLLNIAGDSSTAGTDYIYISDGGNVNLNYTGAAYDIGSVYLLADATADSTLTLASSAILNLDDYDDCTAIGNCAIRLHDNTSTGTGAAVFNVNGTVNTVAGTEQSIQLGSSGTGTTREGELNIGSTGTVNLDNTSGGEIRVDDSGRLTIADGGALISDSPMDIDGMYNDGTGNRGAYIDGTCTVDTSLDIEATAFMDVGSNGEVTVTGSTTSVYGNVELDGTLNAGDLTVYSGGVISSGDGNHLTTGSGCGVGGNFGCGVNTAFYINADNLDIQSGGAISSDAISVVNPGSSGAGSHIGEGEGRTGTGNTYGKVKLDEAGTPTYGDATNTPGYGQAGANLALAPDGHGGGGVRIYTNGNFTNNGTISANGEASTGGFGAGAGGTVIIVQNPSATGAYFIGTGDITANGGAEGTSTLAGGGGLVIIKSPLLDDPDFSSYDMGEDGGSVTALPGTGGGAAGAMVYLGDRHNDDTGSSVYGSLIVDQSGIVSTVQTEIPTTGNDDFARIEARGDADVVLDATAVDPTSCFDLGASNTVTGPTCTSNPDKPDSLHIEATWTGTTAGTATEEPGYITPTRGVDPTVYTVADIGPVFAMYFRNPEATTTDHQYVEIQVADNAAFSNTGGAGNTIFWDATGVNAVDLGAADLVQNGDWTRDIEYNENNVALGNLTKGTPYFVRARFKEGLATTPGLWTHGDYNDQYKFTPIEGSNISVEDCNDDPTGMKLTQDGTGGGVDINPDSGERHGYGTCDVHVSTTETDWEVYYSMATSETDFDNGLGQSFLQTTDCDIPTTGAGTQNESGYQLITTTDTIDNTIINSNVGSDTQCSAICTIDNAYNASDCYFDFELIGTRDTIFDTDNGSASALNDGIFKIEGHANTGESLSVGNYSLDTTVTLTVNP